MTDERPASTSRRSDRPPSAGRGAFDALAGLFFQTAPDGLLAVDVQTEKVIRANPAADRLFGFSNDGMSGVYLYTLMELPAARTDWVRKLSFTDQVQESVRMRMADGRPFVADVRASLVDLGGAATLLINVREREQAQQRGSSLLSAMAREPAPASAASVAARRNTDNSDSVTRQKNEFSSIVSHTVRTPLAVILSSVSMLTRYTDQITPERRTEHLRRIEQQVHHLSDFLYDLRLLTRIESGLVEVNRTAVDINELLPYVLTLFAAHKTQPEIRLELQASNTIFQVDRDLLKPALFAIIKNAIVYSPADSIITIRGGLSRGMLTLIIEDQGKGMPPGFVGKAFEPFLRGENTSGIQGAGLGLATARAALSLMGGVISLHSSAEGTTATIVLPVA
jgi:PAS domain S-box-containing protein